MQIQRVSFFSAGVFRVNSNAHFVVEWHHDQADGALAYGAVGHGFDSERAESTGRGFAPQRANAYKTLHTPQ